MIFFFVKVYETKKVKKEELIFPLHLYHFLCKYALQFLSRES